MILRAVIFDLYGTILEFGPAPADAPARWEHAWQKILGRAPRLGLAEFTTACRAVVATEHAAARARGIPFPEVHWPAVVDAVLPEFAALPPPTRLASPVYSAELTHTVRLMPGAAAGLHAAAQAGLLLGVASNCQPYTLDELDTALAGTGFARERFDLQLTFLSFEHGFSKPDPHVFRLLTARLRLRGLPPATVLMVGDREDNDLAPARAQGWQVARIGRDSAADDWRNLRELFLSGAAPRSP